MNRSIFRLCWEIDKRMDICRTVESCNDLLKAYQGSDYLSYFKRSETFNEYGYKKMHIYGTKNVDIYLIHWKPKSITPMHSHPERGCLMKVLHNKLVENEYDLILDKINNRILQENDITYIEGNFIQHTVSNSTDVHSISLHVYGVDQY